MIACVPCKSGQIDINYHVICQDKAEKYKEGRKNEESNYVNDASCVRDIR